MADKVRLLSEEEIEDIRTRCNHNLTEAYKEVDSHFKKERERVRKAREEEEKRQSAPESSPPQKVQKTSSQK